MELTVSKRDTVVAFLHRLFIEILEFRCGRRSLEVKSKEDGSPVTSADLFAHEQCQQFFGTLFPGVPILSEEGHHLTNPVRAIVIDPIDGTSNFIDGRNDYGVLIAYVEEGRVGWSFVGVPEEGRVLIAVPGEGVEVADGSSVRRLARPLSLSPELRPLVRNCFLEGGDTGVSPNSILWSVDEFVSGEFNCLINRVRSGGVWDYAPMVALIEALGGKVTDIDGTPWLLPLTHRQLPDHGFRFLIASFNVQHNDVLELARQAQWK